MAINRDRRAQPRQQRDHLDRDGSFEPEGFEMEADADLWDTGGADDELDSFDDFDDHWVVIDDPLSELDEDDALDQEDEFDDEDDFDEDDDLDEDDLDEDEDDDEAASARRRRRRRSN